MVKKRIMQVAGVLNIIVGLSAMIRNRTTAQHFHGHGYQFASPEQQTYFIGLFFFVFVFGLIYLLVSSDLSRYRWIVMLSALGKLGVFALASYLYLNNLLTNYGMTVSSINDLVMAALFVWIALSVPSYND